MCLKLNQEEGQVIHGEVCLTNKRLYFFRVTRLRINIGYIYLAP